MLTPAVQPSGLRLPVHNRHLTHLWTGQRCRRRPLVSSPEISAVRYGASTAPSVPVRPRSVAPRHQSNSEAGRTAIRVARRSEGLPHLGTCLPVLSALQSLPSHTYSTGRLYTPAARFRHVHIDLVGPLPTSAGYAYCLTAVDRFTRWPEVVPIPDITADTVARAPLTGWISRFCCPQTITTDQGRQFESQLFQSLARLCGIQLSRTTAHLPAANGIVERFHRTLKAAIMCHADQQWTETLPLVLLGIRTAFKEDLQASVAIENTYSGPYEVLSRREKTLQLLVQRPP
ncbi:hypothetical protein B7P43_G17564 [Cryptotermes secundus]|uniref:Integrase catalytic domain-containing protein n=1 Tax=Cryptotermes secundus TaxID=105785 RepID=A0A2J7Q7Z7_9NEOP|nr:hypothetical protein B7P43_G17564 [Cryptotermes secundus]